MDNWLAVLYLVAAILFILSLGGLSHQETARRGNTWDIVGMSIALVGTLLHPHVERYEMIGPAILVGALIGALMAIRVVMTASEVSFMVPTSETSSTCGG